MSIPLSALSLFTLLAESFVLGRRKGKRFLCSIISCFRVVQLTRVLVLVIIMSAVRTDVRRVARAVTRLAQSVLGFERTVAGKMSRLKAFAALEILAVSREVSLLEANVAGLSYVTVSREVSCLAADHAHHRSLGHIRVHCAK